MSAPTAPTSDGSRPTDGGGPEDDVRVRAGDVRGGVDLDLAALEREGRPGLDDDRLAQLLETLVQDAEVFGEGANAYAAGVTDTMRAVRDALDHGTATDDGAGEGVTGGS